MSSPTSESRSAPSPVRLLWITALSIFVAEVGIMIGFERLPRLPALTEALLDATLLSLCMLPVLYLTWVRLLKRAVDDHARARAAGEARVLRDALTQLPNRLAFEHATDAEIANARRHEANLSLVLLDVRRFHQINHVLGQANGDELLRQIAERLRTSLPSSALVTRLGTDIFGVTLPGIALDTALEAATRVHQIIESPFLIEGSPIELEGHCGIAVFPEHGGQASLLLQRAELALRHAKDQGERGMLYQETGDAATRRRLKLFGLLRHAIQTGALSLRYQPKVEAWSGKLIGAEALLSWQHPELGVISPAEFVPIAEQTSLIKPLTAWVLEEAVRQLAIWNSEGLAVRVSVNLSTRNLSDESLPADLARLLSERDVKATSIIAEITESAVLAEPERSASVLEELCRMGIALSLDDFGTGYSSLTYLRTIPAKELKIDRSFVRDLDENEGNASIVRAIVNLAHDLGLEVVAEGVETASVLQRLRALGCDVIQGYFVSRPLTAQQFSMFARSSKHGCFPSEVSIAERPLPTGIIVPHISVSPPPSGRPLRDSLRSLRAIRIPSPRSDAPP